jgi:hypothetical protein
MICSFLTLMIVLMMAIFLPELVDWVAQQHHNLIYSHQDLFEPERRAKLEKKLTFRIEFFRFSYLSFSNVGHYQ